MILDFIQNIKSSVKIDIKPQWVPDFIMSYHLIQEILLITQPWNLIGCEYFGMKHNSKTFAKH